MIKSKTPLRISLAGGGTDLHSYYRKGYGAVTSFTIDKYIYVIIKNYDEKRIKLSYSSREEIVENIELLEHPIIKEALKVFNISGGIEIISCGDVPGGTGLGSSSSFTVGLVNALYKYKDQQVNSQILAETACKIEIDIMNKPIGKQDQYAAAFGGCNYFQFNSDDTVTTIPLKLTEKQKQWINGEVLLFYTGIQRSADDILGDQMRNISLRLQELDLMCRQAEKIKRIIENRGCLAEIGDLLDHGWECKKRLSDKISSDSLNELYTRAKRAGAIGGKITGAGGGGMLLLYCPQEYQQSVREELSDLQEIFFNYVDNGSFIEIV
ncbi:GHMP family kinase ATP-binding protein [Geosporobacter ferrireducens]|uniref:GHMP kinase n=1 Tax=Geosporobacter ferrireducens TaxID=1424294 RepID=A0A1D8GI39_9FIRM|nr:hypothetical protein [Geosporobacter ferrireducens]AOT70567.1 hypothetical protein Gferi_13890 [Geosporobacter ferrireducens]